MEKLIDLSKRNRFLNFRPGKSSAVMVVEELPAEIYRVLVATGAPMRFLPKREAPPEPRERETALIERHRDRNLQTALDEETLDKVLLRIFLQSRSVFEEHGYHTLHLALGFLEWFETKADPEPLRAPLLLVPVVLERKTVAAPFVLKAADDETVVNPALARKLQAEFGIALPALPEDPEGFDPAAWFLSARESVKGQERWRVNDEIALAMFSFAKYAMYRDLEEHGEPISKDARMGALAGAGPWAAKPPPPLPKDLESGLAPETTFQVVDADSSQQEVILAAKSGTDLVVEGPPGTGKSQTITNLVAEFLAAGKSVLFVSEKMAALEVVYDRLKRAGLGDFCLEMHSHKASKKKVIEELRRTLEGQRPKRAEDESSLKRLAETRAALNESLAALHGPVAPLGGSPYEAIAYLAARAELSEVRVPITGAETWTRATFDDCAAKVKRLSEAFEPVRPRASHPWRGSELTESTYDHTLKVRAAIESLCAAVPAAVTAFRTLRESTGSPAAKETLEEAERVEELAQLLSETPKPDAALLERDVPAGTEALCEQGARFRTLRAALREGYRDELLEASLDDAIAVMREVGGKWYRWFVGRWRAARNLLRSFAKPGYTPKGLEDLERAKEAQQLRIALNESKGAAIFGSAWAATESDWDSLRKMASWLTAWRRHVAEGRTGARTNELAGRGFDAQQIQPSKRATAALRETWGTARDQAQLKPEWLWSAPFVAAPFDRIEADAKAMLDGIERLHEWTRYMAALVECDRAGQGAFIKGALESKTPVNRLEESFRCQFFRTWLDAVVRQRPSLKEFDGRAHERLAAEFRELDLKQLEIARNRLVNRLVAALPDLSWKGAGESELGILQHEVRKKRAHLPIRKLFSKAPNALRSLKPCLLMSPLSVAQFLDPAQFRADVVIFDEASQIAPEDAVGSIARGRQLIVVGDSRQLPPTSFFHAEQPDEEDEESLQATSLESVLDACASKGVPRRRLLWHYRSRHESLIAFSNRNFYENTLVTFPSVAEAASVEFRHVKGAIYERGGGANKAEAAAVAKAVFEQLKRDAAASVGVGAFGVRQQEAIQDALEELRREDPSLESRFDVEAEDYCFVKNLETIQGDERDVVFISVGYGRDAGGKVSMNFGPLNQEGGDRRLNVLVTRAREKVVVFSSITSTEIDLTKTASRGVALLKKYLEYAERGTAEEASAESAPAGAFDGAVSRALRVKGLNVVPQVGCSSFRVDFGVPEGGRYVLGIECDGPQDLQCRTTRDRHRLRRQALEARGWRLGRAWALDWWRQPAKEAERLAALAKSPPEERPAAPATTQPTLPRPAEAAKVEPAGPPIPPYKVAPFTLRGAPEDFYEVPARELAKVLVEVVAVEGPMHRLDAVRRVASSWGVTKALKKVRERVDDGIDEAARAGRVKLKDEFVWSAEMSTAPVRSRRELEEKDIDFVSIEEIAEAAALVLKKEFRLGRESLADQSLKVLGFDRPTVRARERAGQAIEALIGQGRCAEEEGSLRPR
jgi:hypothetical protein